MKPSVYVETTIISYLTAWRSPQLVMAANQEVTRTWWDEHRQDYELFVSTAVRDEAMRGDSEASAKRIEIVDTLEELFVSPSAADIADEILSQHLLPDSAAVDALHIAIAAVNRMDYLLTWNCRHIANATLRLPITRLVEANGLAMPVICTPLELIEGGHDAD